MDISERLRRACGTIRDLGGRVYLTGECVRDHLRGVQTTPRTYELIVFNVDEGGLIAALAQHGVVVMGDCDCPYVLRIPVHWSGRIIHKVRIGHEECRFSLAHPGVTPTEWATRRDFTIHAILYDPLGGDYVDPHRGREDVQTGALEVISSHFAEHPEWVIKGVRLASQLEGWATIQTEQVCRKMLVDHWKVSPGYAWQQWRAWAHTTYPSFGLVFLDTVGWLGAYPALGNMAGVPQSPRHHPEGGVLRHCLCVCDAAARLADRDGLQGNDRTVLLLAALLHDVGKPSTTVWERDEWRSPGHAEAGVPIADAFLTSIGCHQRIKDRVLPLVAEHMFPTWEPLSRRSLRRLMVRLRPATVQELHRLMEADASGRPPIPPAPLEGSHQLLDMAAVMPDEKAVRPILLGRHLLALGHEPGPAMGVMLRAALEAQLEGAFEDVAGGIQWVADHGRPVTV